MGSQLDLDDVAANHPLAFQQLHELRTQLAEAQRDAERWRWLRNHARIFRQSPDMSGNHYWMVQTTTTLRGPTLDAAIDAAKGESNGTR